MTAGSFKKNPLWKVCSRGKVSSFSRCI